MTEKRVLKAEQSKGFSIQDLIIVAVLLAAGTVLKLFVGSVINFFGMKPNFIIAAYCLAILLVRPNLAGCAVIGILAGAFGNYISVTSAQKIGLLPTGRMKIVPVGNGAGSGAIHCLLSTEAKKQTEAMAGQCTVINLTNDAEFNTQLVANTVLSPR